MKYRVQHTRFIILCSSLWLLLAGAVKLSAQDLVADNMLLFQRTVGGWPKHYAEKAINYKREYSEVEKATILDEASRNDATIDNNATTKEIRYLLKAYQTSGNATYLSAAQRGIRYLLQAQYKNGGWPQFYPDKSSYRGEITFNDNAMINAMQVLNDLANGKNGFEAVDAELVKAAAKSVKKGIDCILKTQVKVNGKLTVWCAQYNAETLEPAKARTFELASLSGGESASIVEFLMEIPHPSPEIKLAINSAVDWFKAAEIKGYKFAFVRDSTLPKGFDRVLQPEEDAIIWARFYDIETNEPFFCGRDGIKKKSVAEIEYERRTGYGWYGTWPKDIIETKYPAWKAANG